MEATTALSVVVVALEVVAVVVAMGLVAARVLAGVGDMRNRTVIFSFFAVNKINMIFLL